MLNIQGNGAAGLDTRSGRKTLCSLYSRKEQIFLFSEVPCAGQRMSYQYLSQCYLLSFRHQQRQSPLRA